MAGCLLDPLNVSRELSKCRLVSMSTSYKEADFTGALRKKLDDLSPLKFGEESSLFEEYFAQPS